MRTLKFRVWIKKHNKFASFFEIYSDGSWGWEEYTDKFGETEFFLSEDGDELMQYTGLKDKNGKEIYENDLVGSAHHVGQVVMYNSGFAVGWKVKNGNSYTDLAESFETLNVIGNIYENAELLDG